jgi:hypothetical protein
MHLLRETTASRFFKDTPGQDEKVPNTELGVSIDFDLGIQSRSIKKKCNFSMDLRAERN